MIDLLGYGALVLNLVSMGMSRMISLRAVSLVANSIYVVYGLMIDAMPIAVGCSIAVAVHGFHLYRSLQQKRQVRV